MRAREEGRPAGGRGQGKKRRNEERRTRVPHQQGSRRAGAGGARREGDTATSKGTTTRTTTRGREGERGAQERRRKRGSTTHHGTTAQTAPPRTHTNTQTPHRHHAHQAQPHTAANPTDGRHTNNHTAAPTASERRAPATRPTGGQPGEDERLTPGAPSQRCGAPLPPVDALPPPQQRATPAGKSARCGAGAGSPRLHQPRAGNTGNGAWLPAPRDGRPEERKRLTPDAPHNSERSAPPGQPPTTPPRRSPLQGTHAKGTVPDPHAGTAAPTARGQRTPPDECLTSDAPHKSTRHPPRGRPPATPTARNGGSQERTLWSRCWVPTPTPPTPGKHGQWGLAARPQGQAAGRGIAPDTRRSSQR